ncbi:hypothetical protein [Synechococcus phage S-H25]|nr:hypothetical protein [Synechococcus phage S-H25]
MVNLSPIVNTLVMLISSPKVTSPSASKSIANPVKISSVVKETPIKLIYSSSENTGMK